MILGLLYKLINFALLSLGELVQFDTLPGWEKLWLKCTSSQVKLKLGLSLIKKNSPFSPITLVDTDAEGVGSMLSSFTSGLSKNFIDKKK